MKRTLLSVATVVALLFASSNASAEQTHGAPISASESALDSLIAKATADSSTTNSISSSTPYYTNYTSLERDNAASWDLFDRVVVMGDLHGDVRKLHMLLRGAGLIGRRAALATDLPTEPGDIYPEWHWRARRTLLVQLGDMVDRGWYDLEVVRYLMRLEAEARAMDSAVEASAAATATSADAGSSDQEDDVIVTIDASNKIITRDSAASIANAANASSASGSNGVSPGASRAVILLGNHELMQLSGQMHYASAQATQGWGGAATRHRDLDRDAPIGKWLRHRPVVMLAWDTVFVHAGLSSDSVEMGADGLNERMWRQLNATIAPPPAGFDLASHEAAKSEQEAAERAEIRRRRERLEAAAPRRRRTNKRNDHASDAAGKELTPEQLAVQAAEDRVFAEEEEFMLGESGPVWTRRMVTLAQQGRCDLIVEALNAWNKTRIIVGHTPTRTAQVEAHCGGRLIAADTGLSEWMYGGKSIVEMKKVKAAAGSAGAPRAPQGNDDSRVEVAELTFENEAEAEAAAAQIEAAERAALHTKTSKQDAAAAQSAEEIEAALRGDPETLQEILQLLAEQKRADEAAAAKKGSDL